MAGESHFEYYETEPTRIEVRPTVWEESSDWRWRLRAANGEVVASGEGFTREEDVQRAIETVVTTCRATLTYVSPGEEDPSGEKVGTYSVRVEKVDA